MADDDDTIYIDVKAKVDEASFDEAEGRLRDKFKDVGKNIGDSIKDATSSIGEHVKDATRDIRDSLKSGTLHDVFKDTGKIVGDELKKSIGVDRLGEDIAKELAHGDIGGALGHVGDTVTNTTGLIKDLGEVFGVHLDGVDSFGQSVSRTINNIGDAADKVTNKVHGFTDAIKSFRSHDAAGGLSGISGLFGGVDAIDQASATAGAIQEITSALGEFAPAIAPLAGPAAAGAAVYGLGAYGLYKGLDVASGHADLNNKNRQDYADYLARGGGKLGPDGKPLTFEQYVAAQGYADLYPVAPGVPGAAPLLGSPTAEFDASTPGPTPQQPGANEVLLPIPGGRLGTRGPQQVLAGPMPAAGAAPMGATGAVTHAQEAVVEAASAVISAGSLSLGGISLPTAYVPGSSGHADVQGPPSPSSAKTPFKPWYPSKAPQSAQNLGDLLGGRSSGGMIPGDSPGYDNRLGSVGGKPIGLEGGEFVVNPDATQSNLPLLRAINSGKLSHFDEGGGPVGAPAPDPNITTQPEPPTSGPIQQQQMGHGSGVGVTGGGALGMAEQAGVMAATMFGFGGGGMAAQIGMQEMNLAIQEGGKMGAAAAMALPETFGLAGGQMGAPSVGQGGWFKKIVGGMLGSMTNLPNVAGATQPPKQHGQKEGGPDAQVADDPLNGSKQPPQQGKTGGPTGHKDDPIHVQQVQPGGQPQGQATSAMNMSGVMSGIPA